MFEPPYPNAQVNHQEDGTEVTVFSHCIACGPSQRADHDGGLCGKCAHHGKWTQATYDRANAWWFWTNFTSFLIVLLYILYFK